MIQRNLTRIVPRTLITLAVLAIAPGLSGRAIAQETYPACEPPDAGEYLLLVQGDVDTAAAQIQEAFPDGADIAVCSYLDSIITRVGGFTDADTAATWAQYLSDVGGLNAYVARPADAAPEEAAETEPESEAASEDTQDTPEPDDSPAQTPENEPTVEEASEPEQPAAESTEPEAPPASDASSEGTGEPEQPAAESAEPEETPADDTSQQPTAEPDTTVAFPAPTATTDVTLVTDVTETTAAEPQPSETTAAEVTATIGADPVFDPKRLGDGYAVLVAYDDQPEIAASLQGTVSQPIGLVSYNQKPYLLVSHTTSSEEAGQLLQSLSSQFTTILVDSSMVILLSPAIALVP